MYIAVEDNTADSTSQTILFPVMKHQQICRISADYLRITDLIVEKEKKKILEQGYSILSRKHFIEVSEVYGGKLNGFRRPKVHEYPKLHFLACINLK